MYTSFELRDGILQHLGTRSILTVGVLAVVGTIGSTAWSAHWADAIALL
jgi:hypothetical protein